MEKLATFAARLSPLGRLSLALLIYAAAFALRLSVLPLNAGVAYMTFAPATVLVFYLCGTRLGWLVAGLSAVTAYWAFTPPYWDLGWSLTGLYFGLVFMAASYLVWRVVAALQASNAALAQSERFLRNLTDQIPIGLSYSDAHGRFSFVNQTVCELYGLPRGALLGRTRAEVLSADVMRQLEPALAAAVQGKADRVVVIVGEGASQRRIDMRTVPDLSPSGQVLGMFMLGDDLSDLWRTDQRIKANEALLERMGRVAGVGGWQLDLRSQSISWTHETYRIHGLGPEHVPDVASGIDFYAPEARPVIAAAVQAALNEGTPWDLELPFITATGFHIWVRATGEVDVEDGQPVRLVGAFQDVTERRRLAEAALKSERFVRQVVDSVPALIAHVGPDQRYTLVNQPYTAWDHRSRDEIVGRSVEQVHGPAGYALLRPWLERALAGEPVAFEVELPRHGERLCLQVHYLPERDASGRVSGVFSMKSDVTALRRAEERLHQVMQTSPMGLFIRDLDGKLLYANPAWLRIVGLSAEQAAQASLTAVVNPDDAAMVGQRWLDVLAGVELSFREFRYRRPDGSDVWVRGHMGRLLRAGLPEAVVGVAEDITDRHLLDIELARQRAALASSNEDLERFAYVASHDLQEPLRMVTSYGQLLMRRHAEQLNPEAQEFLAFMVDGGQRAQALIRDLLSLARLDNAAAPRTDVPLDEVLAHALHELRERIAQSAARVSAEPLPTVRGDRSQLRQLFINLLSNALKFHGAEPCEVRLSAQTEGRFWRIEVQDNGIGIEAKFFERIFVMFQRLHLRSAHEGTGIGLAICKRVVQRHGGQIGVRSTPGEGSCFFFTLPQVGHTD